MTGPALSLRLDRMGFADAPPLFADFTLEVPAGQCLALIGPSGTGKTTLLRLLAGTETRLDGAVLVGNVPPGRAPAPGLVFQDVRLLPWLTLSGNLRAVAPQLSDDAIEAALSRVGLAGQAEAWPRQLSGGMLRRAGLARALAAGPRLWLLDEPFAGLDRAAALGLKNLLAGLIAASRPTCVLVSHDPEDAARLAERAVLLAGRPARLHADLALGPDPAARTDADIAAIAERIAAAL